MQSCRDLWPRTNSLQHSHQAAGGGDHLVCQLAPENSSTITAQRRHPCVFSSTGDGSAVPEPTSISFQYCSDAAERPDLSDKYGIVNVDRGGLSTRQTDTGLDLDLVDGVVDRITVDERPTRVGDLLAADQAPLFGDPTTLTPRRQKYHPLSQPRHDLSTSTILPPRRVNFDVGGSESSAYRPVCNCGTLSGTDQSPYYFKLDDVDAATVIT